MGSHRGFSYSSVTIISEGCLPQSPSSSFRVAPGSPVRVTFEKGNIGFFVTFFSCVFPRKNPSKRHLLLCDLFSRCIPSNPSYFGFHHFVIPLFCHWIRWLRAMRGSILRSASRAPN